MGGGLSRLPFVSPSLSLVFALRMVPATGSTRLGIRIAYSVVSGLAKKGRFHERNQYFTRSAHHAVHDPAAPLDAQAETRGRRVSITEDVPVLRIDHVPIKGELLGVWQALYSGRVLDFKEINRRLVQASENFSFNDIRYEKHQICRESEPTRHSRPPNAKTPLALHPASDKNHRCRCGGFLPGHERERRALQHAAKEAGFRRGAGAVSSIPRAHIAAWGQRRRRDHNDRRNRVSSRNHDGASSAPCSRRGHAVASRSFSPRCSGLGR